MGSFDNMSIRQGATLQFPIVADDVSAQSVQFQAFKDGIVYIDEFEPFTIVNGKAQATIFTNDTSIPIDTYDYMITINYSDGATDKLPDPEDCDGECEFPKLIICDGGPSGVS